MYIYMYTVKNKNARGHKAKKRPKSMKHGSHFLTSFSIGSGARPETFQPKEICQN